MAQNVVAQVLGGKKELIDDVDTVAEVAAKMDISMDTHAAAVNGDAAEADTDLEDSDFVTFTKKVKGGQ